MSAVEAYKTLARTKYRAYVHYTNAGRWIPARALCYIADKIQEFIERPATDETAAYEILIVTTPPQHGKSTVVSDSVASWYIGKNPDGKVITLAYGDDLVKRFGRENRKKIDLYGQELFGISLARDARSAQTYGIHGRAGRVIFRGTGGGVTGEAAELLIIDDPIKNQQEADSPVLREKIWHEWVSSYRSRLAAGAKVILIQTRWHEDDLAGRMIKHEKNVEVINLPCEAEENDPLGRRPGEALCPELGKGDKWLKAFKAAETSAAGSRAWYALYQGRPTVQEGAIIKRKWWRYYDGAAPAVDLVAMSIDAAFKGNEDSDYVAIQLWGKKGSDIYLLDMTWAQMDFPETLRAIHDMRARHPIIHMVLVEDKANGPAIIQILSRDVPGVIAINPEGGKMARVNAIAPCVEAGNVHLPRFAGFTPGFVDEFTAFPAGATDDRVDAATQAINKLMHYSTDPLPDELSDQHRYGDFLNYGT